MLLNLRFLICIVAQTIALITACSQTSCSCRCHYRSSFINNFSLFLHPDLLWQKMYTRLKKGSGVTVKFATLGSCNIQSLNVRWLQQKRQLLLTLGFICQKIPISLALLRLPQIITPPAPNSKILPEASERSYTFMTFPNMYQSSFVCFLFFLQFPTL